METVKYSPEIADEICRRVANGEPLKSICEGTKGMPDDSAIRAWVLSDRDGFTAKYQDACRTRADRWADEIITIADLPVPLDTNGRGDNAAIQRHRLMVDTRKWIVQKMLPKVYGDRIEHTGDISIQVITGVPHRDDDDDVADATSLPQLPP